MHFLPCLAYMPYQDSSIFSNAVQFKQGGFCSFFGKHSFQGNSGESRSCKKGYWCEGVREVGRPLTAVSQWSGAREH